MFHVPNFPGPPTAINFPKKGLNPFFAFDITLRSLVPRVNYETSAFVYRKGK
jgi:hypothetical protein